MSSKEGQPATGASVPGAKGCLVVVAATSGTGKSTVCRALLAKCERMALSVSYTTRAPRSGEQNGEHYHFVSVESFKEMIAAGEFLEWAEVHGQYYGTGRSVTLQQLEAGRDVLLDIDVQGAHLIRDAFPERAVLLFLLPPSWDEMVGRLRGRGTETEEAIARRLETARMELPAAKTFDYLVINDDLDAAVARVESILEVRRMEVSSMSSILDDLVAQMNAASADNA